MTLPKVTALFAYWKGTPPAHVAVARYLGYEDGPKHEAFGQGPEFQSLETLAEMFGAAGGSVVHLKQ